MNDAKYIQANAAINLFEKKVGSLDDLLCQLVADMSVIQAMVNEIQDPSTEEHFLEATGRLTDVLDHYANGR